MARIVQKFGGTSVADLDCIRNVARRVKTEVDAGNEVAVVVSAMSGATNQLVGWASDIGALHDAREYDTVLATGEQVTVVCWPLPCRILALTRAHGLAGRFLSGRTMCTARRGLTRLTARTFLNG